MGFQYEYGYDLPPVDAELGSAIGAAVGAVLGFVMVFYVLILAVSVVMYVLQSLGLYTIARRRGIHNPWLAWLPVGNMWILGSISDQYQYVAKGNVRNRRKVLTGLTAAMIAVPFATLGIVLNMILGAAMESEGMVGGSAGLILLAGLALIVIAIIAVVYQYITTYDLYRSCDRENAVLYLVLSIFFTICLPIFIFVCRKKDGGMPPRKTVQEPIFQTAEAQEEE